MVENISHQEILQRFHAFGQSAIQWCIAESDASTANVSKAIELLMAKAQRVAKISAAGLVALAEAKKSLEVHKGTKKLSMEVINELIVSLQDIFREHEEVGGIISPIIENLQFQDRLRQRLENIDKMTNFWLKTRGKVADPGGDILDIKNKFAFDLAKLTTSVEERELLRAHYPQLPVEEKVQDSVTMF